MHLSELEEINRVRGEVDRRVGKVLNGLKMKEDDLQRAIGERETRMGHAK